MEKSFKDPLLRNTLSDAQDEISKHNFVAAEMICQNILNRKLEGYNNYEVYLTLAIINYQYKNYDVALAYVNEVISMNAQIAEAYNIAGNIYANCSDNDTAVNYYVSAVNLKPNIINFRINLAESLAKANQLTEAVTQYRECLVNKPSNYALENDLGNTLKRLGLIEDARSCYNHCIEVNSGYAPAWNNLGCLYDSQTEGITSLGYFVQATILNPILAIAYLNCGNVFLQMNIFREACQYYALASDCIPSTATCAHKQLANVHFLRQDYENCILEYGKTFALHYSEPLTRYMLVKSNENIEVRNEASTSTVTFDPTPYHVRAFIKLAEVKKSEKSWTEAKRLYQSALNLSPKNLLALCNIAEISKAQGDLVQALDHAEKAVGIDNCFVTNITLGSVLMEKRLYVRALSAYRKAFELDPNTSDIYLHLGNAYKALGQVSQSLYYFNVYLSLVPHSVEGLYLLTDVNLDVCYWVDQNSQMAKLKEITNQQLAKNIFPIIQPHRSMLFPIEKHQHKAIAKAMASSCVRKAEYLKRDKYVYNKIGQRLKIGYVSSNFGNHCTSHLMQSVPGSHNRDKFEIFCYALNADDKTTFRAKIAQESEHFKDVSDISCNGKVADIIHEDGIDILVNMNVYTKGARNEIFALRPAPIQVAWLGYPGTSGSSFIDYLITDSVASPIEMEDLYTEKLAHMKHTFFIGDHKQMFPHLQKRVIIDDGIHSSDSLPDNVIILNGPDVIKETSVENISSVKIPQILLDSSRGTKRKNTNDGSQGVPERKCKIANGELVSNTVSLTSRQQYGIPDNAMVYCNFNQMYKIDLTVLSLWLTILSNVPNSVLWLLKFPPEAEIHIRNVAKDSGLSANRLIFTHVAPKEEHVRRGQLADVCLDTLICNGHSTTMDLLWTGTPVLTVLGDNIYSRIAASQLTALGCPELIANNKQEYLELAFQLGTDKKKLKSIREKVWLLRSQSILFDVKRFTVDLESLYSEIWERFESGLEPDHIQTRDYCDFEKYLSLFSV